MSIFIGSGAAVCTPFDSNNRFDKVAYEKLINFQIENGTDAIVTCGSTGEASTLSTKEHIEVAAAAVEITNGRVPVMAGAGANDTEYSIRLSQELVAAGVDALMQVTPYYNKTSQKGLVVHFSKIAAKVDVPIMLYNVPSRTGMNLTADTLVKLAEVPNIVAIKEASGDISQITEMIERCKVEIYSGNDDQVLAILALGGKGVVSTTANIAPKAMHKLVKSFMEGNIEESRKLQLGLLPLIRLMFKDVNPMPVKEALNLMGFNMGKCREPLINVDINLKEAIQTEMKRYGIL